MSIAVSLARLLVSGLIRCYHEKELEQMVHYFMRSQQLQTYKTFLKSLPNLSLKFRIIIPFFILIALIITALALSSGGRQELSLGLLLVSFVALLAAVGLGLLLARQIDRRIRRIIYAAERVAQGDFSVRIEDERNDEIGRFVHVFNQMIGNLDDLHNSRDLLSRTMSPAVRQSLIERGLDFRGIIQPVSILFVDIRDFTRITEIHNTEQLVFFLNDYYTTIANQVHSGGGIIGKYAGDSILAYFGAPEPQPTSTSATEALLTALALQDAIAELSERWSYLGLPPIRIGIGMSLGPVVAGPIGSEQQFEYTVIGDAVNLASRLQDLTRNVHNYNIIMSHEVYIALEEKIKSQVQVISLQQYEALSPKDKMKSLLQFVDFGEVLVKGKKGPVRVYGIPD
jgi:adenylate cyclase